MRSRLITSAVGLWFVLLLGAADAAEIKVMYPPPLRTLLSELIPQFEQASGHKALVTYESSWLLVERIRKGETPDVAFLTAGAADELIREGKLARRHDLVSSSIGVAVRTGAPRPDIDTVETFKRTLLAARSFARNEGADSGKFMSGLLERLGIADAMRPKTTLVRQGFVAALVARGEVDLGAQQMPELMAVPGVEAYALPAEIQHTIVFSAATPAAPEAAGAVDELVKFISMPAAASVITSKGLVPMR
jgi:molybdate transport system substrate-binding protein